MEKKNLLLLGVGIILILGIVATYYSKPFTSLDPSSFIPEEGILMSDQEAVNGVIAPAILNIGLYEGLNGIFQGVMLWLILIGICVLIYQNSKKK